MRRGVVNVQDEWDTIRFSGKFHAHAAHNVKLELHCVHEAVEQLQYRGRGRSTSDQVSIFEAQLPCMSQHKGLILQYIRSACEVRKQRRYPQILLIHCGHH